MHTASSVVLLRSRVHQEIQAKRLYNVQRAILLDKGSVHSESNYPQVITSGRSKERRPFFSFLLENITMQHRECNGPDQIFDARVIAVSDEALVLSCVHRWIV